MNENETTEPTAVETDELENAAEDAPEAVTEAEEADTPEAEAEAAPTEEGKEQTKDAPPSMEERMLEMLLREKHPDTLATALANGKTVRGAWNYVVSVMKNAYITAHGRVSGGMCGNPEVVVGIAERYLREFPEGSLEPETTHTPKKHEAQKFVKKPATPPDPAKEAERAAKAAAKAAKEEAKRKREEFLAKWKTQQLSLF